MYTPLHEVYKKEGNIKKNEIFKEYYKNKGFIYTL